MSQSRASRQQVNKRRRRQVPRRAKIEGDLPIEELVSLAEREGNCKRPVYQIHKWWARRLGSNFRMLLLGALLPSRTSRSRLWKAFYSRHRRKALVVLDPFMGGGTSIVEASKLGARTIGSDIDPVAWFITRKEIEPFDEQQLRRAFEQIEAAVAERIRGYYKHRLKNGDQVDVVTYFWVTVVTCPECSEETEAHPHFRLYLDKRNKRQAVICRKCHAVTWKRSTTKSFTCKDCGTRTVILNGPAKGGRIRCICGQEASIVNLSKPGKPLPMKLFALEYELPNRSGREFASTTRRDAKLYKDVCALFQRLRNRGRLAFPRDAIPPEERYDERPLIYGYRKYWQLFNPRQLLSLSVIYKAILGIQDASVREYLLLAFSDSLASNNLMCAYAFGYRKLTPLFGLHAYRFIVRPVEGNVWGAHYGRGSFARCFQKLLRGKQYCLAPFELKLGSRGKVYTGERLAVSTTVDPNKWADGSARSLLFNKDSTRLRGISDSSVDVILTDPPYYNNMPYSELSDFYYVWLRDHLPDAKHRWNMKTTPYRDAMFVRRLTIDNHLRFQRSLSKVFCECRRVIRPDGIMVFTYHHNDRRAWMSLCSSLISAGFRVTNVMPLLSEGKSGFHNSAGNIKWDAVIVCRPSKKPSARHHKESSSAKVAAFAESKLSYWTARLNAASCTLSQADTASLGFAFGLWSLTNSGANDRTILESINAVASEVNGADPPPYLFRLAEGSRKATRT